MESPTSLVAAALGRLSYADVSSPAHHAASSARDKGTPPSSHFRTPGPPRDEGDGALDSDGVPLAVREGIGGLLEEVEMAVGGAAHTLSDEDEGASGRVLRSDEDQPLSDEEESWLGWCPLEGSPQLDGPLAGGWPPSPGHVRQQDCLCTLNVTDRRTASAATAATVESRASELPGTIHPQCVCHRHVTGRTQARASKLAVPAAPRPGG
eukprot:COSAG05_NODE_29_length_29038_cov_1237.466985_33_plen_208_part_01